MKYSSSARNIVARPTVFQSSIESKKKNRGLRDSPYSVQFNAFNDKHGRPCHEIIPTNSKKKYKNINDFVDYASDYEKIYLFNLVHQLGLGKDGYRFRMDNDSKTGRLKIYMAISSRGVQKNKNAESHPDKKMKYYKGQVMSPSNNPLYDEGRDTASENQSKDFFVVIPSLKPNHKLMVPFHKDRLYKDFNDFMEKTKNNSQRRSKEILSIFKTIKEINPRAVYLNVGIARHIPLLHVHLLENIQRNFL